MLNSCEQLKSKHKEKKCEPKTANTNTILDEVMLQIQLNTKLLQYQKTTNHQDYKERSISIFYCWQIV